MAFSPARFAVLGAIAAVHLVGILALAAIRMRVPVEASEPVRVVFLDAAKADDQPPALEPVNLVPVRNLSLPEMPVAIIHTEAVRPAAITVVPAIDQPTEGVAADDAPRRVSLVEYLRPPAPRYPHESRKRKSQGIVVLRVLIDAEGAPASIEIERSSGDSRLDEAARDAVSRAMFKPYREDGVARRALVSVPIEFSLRTRA